MNIEAIKNKVRALSPEDRRILIAYMVALEDESRPEYARTLAERLDQRLPGAWLTIEECKRELGLREH